MLKRSLTCLTVLLVAMPVFAQSNEVTRYLNSAITLYENLEYEKALKQLERARKKATTAEDDTRVSLMEGVLFAELGKDEPAVAAFKTAFGMNPDAKLPVEVSPKVDKVVSAARANVKKMLAPQLQKQREEDDARKAEENKKVEAARLAEEERQRKEDAAKAAANAPPLAATQPAVAKSSGGGSLKPVGIVALGVGAAAAAGATVCLLLAKGDYDGLTTGTLDATAAQAARSGGPTKKTLGVVLGAVAAAAIAAGVVLFVLPGSSSGAGSASFGFFATPEGGAVSASLRW